MTPYSHRIAGLRRQHTIAHHDPKAIIPFKLVKTNYIFNKMVVSKCLTFKNLWQSSLFYTHS